MTWVKEDLMRSVALLCSGSVAHYSGKCENFKSQNYTEVLKGLAEEGWGDSQLFNFLFFLVHPLYPKEQLLPHIILSAQRNAGLILCFALLWLGNSNSCLDSQLS